MPPADPTAWFLKRTVPLAGDATDFVDGTQARDEFDSWLGSAGVIAIGEMTHGARQIYQARSQLLRHLVSDLGVTLVILEVNLLAAETLTRYVLTGEGDPALALAETGSWLCANQETLDLIRWIAAFNAALPKGATRVKVVGCDAQSMDDAVRELRRLLHTFVDQGVVPRSDVAHICTLVAALPSDQQLHQGVADLFAELDSPDPDSERAEHLTATQTAMVASIRVQAQRLTDVCEELGSKVHSQATARDRFTWNRSLEALGQCLDTYALDQGGRVREKHMADNILAWRGFFTGERAVVTSANWHASRSTIPLAGCEDYVTTGSMLATQLGADYVAIGMIFNQGSYLGTTGNSAQEELLVQAHTPRSDAFEHIVHRLGSLSGRVEFAMDMRSDRAGAHLYPWPPTVPMSLGDAGPRRSYEESFLPQSPHRQFDVLIHYNATQPIAVLPEYYEAIRHRWGSAGG